MSLRLSFHSLILASVVATLASFSHVISFSRVVAETRDPVVPASDRSQEAATPETLAEEDLLKTARKAYLWGWPLTYVRNCKAFLQNVPSAGRSGGYPVAPPNQLCMLLDYIAPNTAVITCPNQDVVYGFGILDLAQDAVVLQVPDFGERFWIFQLGDQRTDTFAQVGKMYGTKPGLYLIVGPNWQGTTPPEFAGTFHCPTQLGYCLPRVFLGDSPDDRHEIANVVNKIAAYPLSKYTGRMKVRDWNKVRWLPQLGSSDRHRHRWVSPEQFFDTLNEVLDEVPPLPGEEGLYAEFRQLLDYAGRHPQFRDKLVAGAVAMEAELMEPLFDFHNFGIRLPHHWTTVTNAGNFGTDYLTRAAVAKSNVFINRNHETKYFYQDFDAQGVRLSGDGSYRVTFAPGRLPPAKGFWSLTLYNEKHTFHVNDLGRHSIGTKSKNLQFAEDGSLTIWIQDHPPAGKDLANWLPAPDGPFSLYLRAYWPEPELLNGTWSPPPVVTERANTRIAKEQGLNRLVD